MLCVCALWATYLVNNEAQILLAAFFLIAYALETDLASLLQARLDGYVKHLVGSRHLAAPVECLALDLHLLVRALEHVLQRHRQRPLDSGDLRSLLSRHAPHTTAAAARNVAEAGADARSRPSTAADVAEQVGKLVVIAAAAAATARAHELVEDVVGIGEVEAAGAAGAAAHVEVELAGTTAAAGAATKAAEVEVWGAAGASKGVATAWATLRRCGTAAQEELETELIVGLALLGVGQNLVGLRALLELLGGIGIVFVLVGVPLQGSFPVRRAQG